ALDLRFRRVGEIRPVAFARVDDEQARGTRRFQHRLAGRDRRAEQRHVIAERFAESARLEEVALHVDEDQRGTRKVERHRLGFSVDSCAQRSLRPTRLSSKIEAKQRDSANVWIRWGFGFERDRMLSTGAARTSPKNWAVLPPNSPEAC